MALLVMLAMLHDGGGGGDSDMTGWLAASCRQEEPSRQDKIVGLFNWSL